MISQVLLFLVITTVVGLVNLVISEPLERSPAREFVSYMVVVGGGIVGFTALIVVIAIAFQ